jgi:hypothetical protein
VVGAKVAGKTAQPSLERAARWDGLLPSLKEGTEGHGVMTLDKLAGLVAEVQGMRAAAGLGDAPYDVIIEGDSSREFIQLDPPDPAAWEQAGATWWVESWWTIEAGPEGLAEVRRRIEAGPPS